MLLWDLLVDALRTVLVVLTHALGGSLGSAIAGLSLAVRLLLLPLTLRVALRARALQRRMRELQPVLEPELARLKTRHADDPRALADTTMALYRKHDITPVPRGTVPLMLVQLPLGAALYRAIVSGLGIGQRFLWVADLSRPDAAIAATAALLAAGAAAAGSAPAGDGGAAATTAANVGIVMSALVTLFFAWKFAAGVGIYWSASSAV